VCVVVFALTENEKETQRQRDKSNMCVYVIERVLTEKQRDRDRDKSNMCVYVLESRERESRTIALLCMYGHIVVCLIPSLSKSQEEEANSKKKVLQGFNRSFLEIVLLL
jgi:hypothetical protein